MARISTIGADKVALRLETQSQQGKRKARAMMYAGADILMEYVRNNLLAYGVHDSGELYNSIDTTSYRADADSVHIDVTFKGSRTRTGKRSGKTTVTRNAAIGFIQQYGRKYGVKKITTRDGRSYFTDANREATPKILEKWKEMMHDEQ